MTTPRYDINDRVIVCHEGILIGGTIESCTYSKQIAAAEPDYSITTEIGTLYRPESRVYRSAGEYASSLASTFTWAARNKAGEIRLFAQGPAYHEEADEWVQPYNPENSLLLHSSQLPEVTFNNSPVKISLKVLNEEKGVRS